jgi:transposase
MFIRRVKGGSKNNPIYYLQLVQSYRDKNGKPRHKILCTLGREQDFLNSDLPTSLAKKFAALSKKLILIDKEKDTSFNTYLLGQILALEAVWKKLKLDDLLQKVQAQYQIKFPLNKAVKLMVLNRLCAPSSKLSITKWKQKLYSQEFNEIELQHLYRSLDILAENKDLLERELYQQTQSLFKPVINLVFYDLTTIYFESQKEDMLRCFGYSKDNKTDCVQVVIGLILSEDGLPLGYEIFPGNTFEGKTVSKVIRSLKEKFCIGKVVFVADKGILSKEVLKEIEGAGYEYIVAGKLKQVPRRYHEEIFDRSRYERVSEGIWVREMEIEGQRVVLGYSEERAERDRVMREGTLERLRKKIGQGKKGLINPAYSKYLSVRGGEVSIDEGKVEREKRWDGYFGYVTNNREFTAKEVMGAYKMLYKIEEAFRCMKSSLELRPVYHWSARRIEGHIMLCFLSFYVMRVIERGLREAGLGITGEWAMEELEGVRAIQIRTEGKEIYARTEIEGISNQILRALGVKIPSVILQERDL